jgi:hypothetical protein
MNKIEDKNEAKLVTNWTCAVARGSKYGKMAL